MLERFPGELTPAKLEVIVDVDNGGATEPRPDVVSPETPAGGVLAPARVAGAVEALVDAGTPPQA